MEVLEFGNSAARTVLVQPVDGHDLEGIENELRLIGADTGADFRLIAFKVDDWNRDLSPWEAPAVFGKEGFGGGAAAALQKILEACSDRSKAYYIGGYSLAGLFALWAAYRTDLFRGVAAASPSVWFPGFTDHMKAHGIMSGHVYLSLGDREEKARNPVMASVGARIREAHAVLTAQGIDCALEWNEGNHFKDADVRTAKAFAWVMKRQA